MITNQCYYKSSGRCRRPFGTVLLALCIVLVVASAPSFEGAEAQTVGATTPFTTIEGEAGTLGGGAVKHVLQTIPANALSSPELEASGRSYVELAAPGSSVSWVNPVDSDNTINIRECIPDAPGGGGIDATLDLYINGALRQAIPLTSRQTWVYDGTNGNNNGMDQTPSTGGPHVFYDESRTFITGPALKIGDTIMLKKDAANTASFYYIDCIDLESTAPKARPANSLSVADYGATGTGTASVNSAFNSCCSAAKSQGKPVWVPPGTYYFNSNFSPNGVTIMGAGMWFTTLYFTMGQIQSNSTSLQDFCVDAVTVQRDQGMGGVNTNGSNYVVDHVWAIHGCWAGFWCCGTNVTLQNSRSSICWGDGLNMNNGTGGGGVGTNLLAQNNFTRGCGDDGATVYSVSESQEVNGAILRNNTTVAMWWANGLRIAGGKNVLAENNLLLDDVKEAGLFIGIYGSDGNNLDSSVVTGNVIVRAGGARNPAGICVNGEPGGKLVNTIITHNTIKDAQFYGIVVGSDLETITMRNDTIDHPAQTALWIQGGAKGSANIDSCLLINRIPKQLAFKNDAPSTFTVTWGSHNYGIPDTLATPVAEQAAQISKSDQNLTVLQAHHALLIRYAMPGKNGTAEVTMYNSSGRVVWNGGNLSSHQGSNEILCPAGDLSAGIYVVRLAVSNAENQSQTVLSQTVVLSNRK
jgi:Pectate lyase superfamily protein